MTLRSWLFVLLSLLAAPDAWAHEIRPAYLQVRQTGAGTYDVLWKVPGRGVDLRLGLYAELPADCVKVGQARTSFVHNAFTERWSVRCAGGLTGGTIHIAGLAATMTDVLVRVERLDGTTQVARLTPSAASFVVEAAPTRMQVAGIYMRLGVEHILTGVDHLLYVLAMLLLVTGWKRIVATMTAFTATHSLTLTAATLGWVHVPQPPVEACIALSILFVARETVCSRKGHPGLTERWPWVVSFAFGLLHGFGFAGALSEVGLPQAAIPVALLFFNVGVEVGQLLFIAAAVAFLVGGRKTVQRFFPEGFNPQPAAFIRLAPPYAIGSVAMFWVMQRITGF
ncbi:MAG TPA: HupE/UreJ family protein [Gemmatimonadales bacterium]|nr:HupE/UreJ family protein [Gemmatimonadales bacterium]